MGLAEPKQRLSRANGSADKVKRFEHDTTPINAKFSQLRPLYVKRVGSGKELALFKSYIDQYHYPALCSALRHGRAGTGIVLSDGTKKQRFLIFEWVRVPYLASHILSLIAHRIVEDWQSKYGHPIYCLETFVESSRFRGTCYKAANWLHVGSTTG